MGTYNLPRNVKGEGRILFIFSAKALICTAIGGAIGLVFYLIFSLLSSTTNIFLLLRFISFVFNISVVCDKELSD